ncbi:MAG: hypothetical protein MZV64_27285 [Ignavibacteriales bacterium]|nr:hypothetical protein [Ignavibacteriales bacterium]
MTEKNIFLTIHGHFYQPPRENPWLESIEMQAAAPFHDWNERIAFECYTPNSVSRIVDSNNGILDVVNNYEHIALISVPPFCHGWKLMPQKPMKE